MAHRDVKHDPDEPATGGGTKPKPCPECGAAMIPGAFRIEATTLGWLFFGISYQHCWFRPEGGGSREVVIHRDGTRAGYRCPQCATALITDPAREPLGWVNMRRNAARPVTPASGDSS